MKNITDDLKNVIKNHTTNLVRCWKITLKDGKTIAFTTASEDFIYENLKYNHISADDISTVNTNLDINNDAANFSNFIHSDLIDANDILSGRYDSAKVELFILDLQNLEKGKVVLMTGKISDIQFKNEIFIVNVKGLKDEINKVIGDVYSPLCRAKFCDKKCKLNGANFEFNGQINAVIDNTTFQTRSKIIIEKPNDYFENGIIEFLDGNNVQQKIEIKQFNNGVFMLFTEPPYKLAIGDTFKAIAGCDKRFETCCDKFNNAINFRGEPHLPGIELLLKVM